MGLCLSARILGTDAGAGTTPPGRLSPLRAGVLDGWESVDGSAGHCLPYLFPFICAVRPALAGRWALIESSRKSLACSAGQSLVDDRLLYRPERHCSWNLVPSALILISELIDSKSKRLSNVYSQ